MTANCTPTPATELSDWRPLPHPKGMLRARSRTRPDTQIVAQRSGLDAQGSVGNQAFVACEDLECEAGASIGDSPLHQAQSVEL